MQGGEIVNTLSGHRLKLPTQPTNCWTKNWFLLRKGKIEKITDYANKKALSLLLKFARSTLRSFHRDTEKGIKALRARTSADERGISALRAARMRARVQMREACRPCVLRGGTCECRWATKTPRVTRASAWGKGNQCIEGAWRYYRS